MIFRGPCLAIPKDAAQKIYKSGQSTALNGQRNEDVFWNGILRVKSGVKQSYLGPLCVHLQDKNLRKLRKKSKIAAFDAKIKELESWKEH